MAAPDIPDLPDALEHLSPKKVRKLVGDVNEATIWRMRQRGEFPEPIRISPGRVAYLRKDIERWLEQRRIRSRR
jgi:predicted DNA-binding transcriptional regulator AlpA